MPRPSQAAKILDAALECFAEAGYDATRIRMIAERAGVSEGALYRHYPSKEAVAQALFQQHLEAFAAQLQQIAATAEPPAAQVRAVVSATLVSYRENPAAFTFVLLRQPATMPLLPSTIVYPLDVVAQMIADGQRQGALRSGKPNLLAAILLGCVLRPIIVAQLAQPGALNLLHDTEHDAVIADAACAALVRSPADE